MYKTSPEPGTAQTPHVGHLEVALLDIPSLSDPLFGTPPLGPVECCLRSLPYAYAYDKNASLQGGTNAGWRHEGTNMALWCSPGMSGMRGCASVP